MSEIRVENIIGETGTDAVKFTKGINATGIVTATSFAGSGAALTGISAGNTNAMQVLEEFFVPCDGTAVTTSQGSVAITNVTTNQLLTASLVTVTGSEISYQPPANTKIVVYSFEFGITYQDSNHISGFQLQLDGVAVGKRLFTFRGRDNSYNMQHYSHGFRIESGVGADPDVGRVQSWNSAKTIRILARYWSNSFEASLHKFGEGFHNTDANNLDNNVFCMPCVGIKAIGSV